MSSIISIWFLSFTFRDRVQAYEKALALARHLVDSGDLNMGFAVLVGLQDAALYRLKVTRACISKKAQDIDDTLTALFSRDLGWRALRRYVDSHDIIPYLGMALTDITFICEGNSILKNGIGPAWNFERIQMVYQTSSSICDRISKRMIGLDCNEDDRQWVEKIMCAEIYEAKTAWECSLKLEPRGCKKEDLSTKKGDSKCIVQ